MRYKTAMTGDQMKAWRSTRKISQASLAGVLGISRESVVRYEQSGDAGVPKLVELALASLALGFDHYSGGDVAVNVFKLEVHDFGRKPGERLIETANSFRHGRTKPFDYFEISEFLKRNGVHLGEDRVFALNDHLVREFVRDFY